MSKRKDEERNINPRNRAPGGATELTPAALDVPRHSLSLLDKMLPLWIILCMAAGLLLGKFINGSKVDLLPAATVVGRIFSGSFSYDLAGILSLSLPIGLFFMIYPAMTKVHFEDAKSAFTNMRANGIVIFFNYFVNPFLLWIFGWIFLRQSPELWTGLILLGVAPCIGMVLVWTDLSGGNGSLAVILVIWNSLIQIVTTPLFIFLIIGSRIPIDVPLIAESVALFLGLPLITGIISRELLMKNKGHEWFTKSFTPVINKVQLGALLFTLIIMFTLKGDVIIAKPFLIPQMALPLTLFFVVIFLITFWVGKKIKLNVRDRIAASFNSTGRNFEFAIAIALTAFAGQKMVGVATVVGPLIEIPVMLFLVSIAKKALARSEGLTSPITTIHQDVYEDDRI